LIEDNQKISRIIEGIIWFIALIFLLLGTSVIYFNSVKLKNTYHIFMPDIDGLIKGSPVRLMGIQIGYVSNLEPIGDEIYLSFVVTHPNLKIPKGASATVEFTGIAGSKSLEISPPGKEIDKNSHENIVIVKQKRLGDFLQALVKYSDLAVEIQQGIAKIRVQDIQKIQEKIINANIKPAEDAVVHFEELQKKHHSTVDKTAKRLSDTSQRVNKVEVVKIDTTKIQQFEKNVDKINEILENFTNSP